MAAGLPSLNLVTLLLRNGAYAAFELEKNETTINVLSTFVLKRFLNKRVSRSNCMNRAVFTSEV